MLLASLTLIVIIILNGNLLLQSLGKLALASLLVSITMQESIW